MSSGEIIRLQNLPITAKAAHIRQFFADVPIPRGAVNICGHPLVGDAFIRFENEQNAEMAMKFDGMLLHNSVIRLKLSSASEMEQVMCSARTAASANTIPPKVTNTTLDNPNSSEQFLSLTNSSKSDLNTDFSNSSTQNSLLTDKNWNPSMPMLKLEGIFKIF